MAQSPLGDQMKAWMTTGIAAVAVFAYLGQAMAQVRYAPRADDAPIDFFSPYDESYGTSPSFQIYRSYNGAPAVRVVEHCQYPDGWNVTDFSRDVNGIPNGTDHACPVPVSPRRARARR